MINSFGDQIDLKLQGSIPLNKEFRSVSYFPRINHKSSEAQDCIFNQVSYFLSVLSLHLREKD